MNHSVKIFPLRNFRWEEIKPILSGYETDMRYLVEKKETDAFSSFTIRLEKLDQPYQVDFMGDFEEEDFQRFLGYLPQGFSFGAYQEGRLVGFAICEHRTWNRSLWIWEFHVLEDLRGQGVGRALMEQICHKAVQEGMVSLFLETQNTNVPAIRFYRKMGFELDALDFSQYDGLEGHQSVIAFSMKKMLR